MGSRGETQDDEGRGWAADILVCILRFRYRCPVEGCCEFQDDA